jgi:hypothetical protein
MSISVVESIKGALGSQTVADSGSIIAWGVRKRLALDGFAVVQKSKKARLLELLDQIYVDSRKPIPVQALDEARRLAKSL